jgi:hypothetical protein
MQRRMWEARRLLERVRGVKMGLARDKYRAELTLKELDTPSPTLHVAAGKMFLRATPADVRADLAAQIARAEAETATATRQEQQFLVVLENTERDLKALIAAHQQR